VQPEFRRIVAVEAHPLGTGETFEIRPAANGFFDVTSGLDVRVAEDQITVPSLNVAIDFKLSGDVGFDGYDHASGEPFSGRAGGGASVTLYDRGQNNYFQYAVAADGDRI
jgi:hypothetical protein